MTEHVRDRRSWWRTSGEEETNVAEPVDAEAASSPAILEDSSALRARYRISGHPSFMFIGFFGMTGEAIAETADLVDEELSQKGLIPVYLVDQAEFSALRAKQRLFEFLPSHWQGARRSPDLDWPLYLRRRYLLLQMKWRPLDRIDFGTVPGWLSDHSEMAASADTKTPRP